VSEARNWLGSLMGRVKGGYIVATAIEVDWRTRAECRGPQARAFFPPGKGERRDEKRHREDDAKAICEACVVREDCLSYALSIREPHGIWGGTTEHERRAMIG
jgi:WhiB family redox-sensing transcriptional regulator